MSKYLTSGLVVLTLVLSMGCAHAGGGCGIKKICPAKSCCSMTDCECGQNCMKGQPCVKGCGCCCKNK